MKNVPGEKLTTKINKTNLYAQFTSNEIPVNKYNVINNDNDSQSSITSSKNLTLSHKKKRSSAQHFVSATTCPESDKQQCETQDRIPSWETTRTTSHIDNMPRVKL
jgi:hypothetical protein